MDQTIFTFVIAWFRVILSTIIGWYEDIYAACGMTGLWIGVVVLSIVFSTVFIPLRGGADLTRGGIGGFVVNQVNKHKSDD